MPAQDQEQWPIIPTQLRTTAYRWQTRSAAYARNSFLAAYSTFIDNTLVAVLQWLRLDELFTKLKPWIEDSLAFLTRKAQPSSTLPNLEEFECTAVMQSIDSMICSQPYQLSKLARQARKAPDGRDATQRVAAVSKFCTLRGILEACPMRRELALHC